MTYALVRIDPPAVAAVTLAEVKAFTRIDFADDDQDVARMIAAATQWLDGADGYLGRALITQTWRMTLSYFPSSITIPLAPGQSIKAVNYIDGVGTTRTLDTSAYGLTGIGRAEGARLRPAINATWPATYRGDEAVTIDFIAGYGDAPTDIPEPIRGAIITRVSQLYENRQTPPEPPADMVQAYRAWTF